MTKTLFPGRKKSGPEHGGILITAILVIVVMLILAIPFLFKLSAGYRSTERGAKALAALNLAEAGVDKVVWSLNSVPSASDKEPIEWSTDGTNQVGDIHNLSTNDSQVMGDVHMVLTPPVGVAPNPQTMILTSTGMVPFVGGNKVDRTVRVVLEQYYKSIFDLGFFVNDYFYIQSGFSMDAYDSRNGPYSTSNSGLPAYFGTNGYFSPDGKPKDFGDASFLAGIDEIVGTFLAGGYAVEAVQDHETGATMPDESLLDQVINIDKLEDSQRDLMPGEYELPSVDVYNLPPKDMLGEMPSLSEWFNVNSSANPEGTPYFADRLVRPPMASEIVTGRYTAERQFPVGSTATLGPGDSGIYTSFILGEDPMEVRNPAGNVTLNVQGDVVIYVTGLADADSPTGRFFMGPNSTINLLPKDDGSPSSLTLVVGKADFIVQQGYILNQTSGNTSDLVILGTDQFALPEGVSPDDISKHLVDIAQPPTPGLMWFEHGQSEGLIYGAIYAPQADFTGTGQGGNHMTLYGALITKYMDFKTQVEFHYDKALGDLNIVKGGFDFWRVISWQEVVGN